MGSGRGWFWGADIVVAASQDVEVTGNTVTVEPGACGIVLIDQGRRSEGGAIIQDAQQHRSRQRYDIRGRPLRRRRLRHQAGG